MRLKYENCSLRSILFEQLKQHSDCKRLIAKTFNANTLKNGSCKSYLGSEEQKVIFLVVSHTLSQCPDWIHPGEFPGENLASKTTPGWKMFGFCTSLMHITQFTSTGGKSWIIDIRRWIFSPVNFTHTIIDVC